MLHPWNPPNREFQIHLYKFELNKTYCLNSESTMGCQGIWVSRFDRFSGCSIFSGNCHIVDEIINEVLQERAQIYRNVICGIFWHIFARQGGFVVFVWCLCVSVTYGRLTVQLNVQWIYSRRGGGLGLRPISRNFMKPTPRRKWYLTTGRRFH